MNKNDNLKTNIQESKNQVELTENTSIKTNSEMENLNPINTADEVKKQKFSLAMAYVPMQKFENLYNSTMALRRGTLFKDLDFPLLREEVIPRER